MITSEEIAQKVYALLKASQTAQTGNTLTISGVVDYERNDYSKEDVIVVPHTMDGESSLRYGQINVNIHVPDLKVELNSTPVFRTDLKRLTEIRTQVVAILQNHVETGTGWNWYIDRFNPPIKEPELNEHFLSLALKLVVRER